MELPWFPESEPYIYEYVYANLLRDVSLPSALIPAGILSTQSLPISFRWPVFLILVYPSYVSVCMSTYTYIFPCCIIYIMIFSCTWMFHLKEYPEINPYELIKIFLTFFFFLNSLMVLYCVHIPSTQSLIHGHLDCFKDIAVINNAEITVCKYFFILLKIDHQDKFLEVGCNFAR